MDAFSKMMKIFWAEVNARPEMYAPWFFVLAILLVIIIAQVRAARASVVRHKVLIATLEKSYYYQQETSARINDGNSEVKGLLVGRDEYLERLLKSLAEKLNGLDVDALSKLLYSEDEEGAPSLFRKVEDALAAHHDPLAKQGVFVYDEIVALTAKIAQLSTLAAEIKTQDKAAQLVEQFKQELSVELTEKLSAALAKQNEQQPILLEMLTQAMNRLSGEVDAKLTLLDSKLEKNMEAKWGDAVASINSLRAQIADVNSVSEDIKRVSANVVSLSRILQSRSESSCDGRQHLAEVLPQVLLPEHFEIDCELPNGQRTDALVRFPNPKDSVAIDAGLSLKSFNDFMASLSDSATTAEARDELRRCFRDDVIRHIEQVAQGLIAPPHTGESALLFVPSEAAFAEIQAHHFEAVVQLALSKRVWLVSPSTLIAVLSTARTAIRDQQARLQLTRLQESLVGIVEEAQLFEKRLGEIGEHVNSAWRSVQSAENASGKLIGSIRGASSAVGTDSNVPQKNLSLNEDDSRS